METKLVKFGLVQVKRSVSWSERLFEIDINSIRYFTAKGELRFEMNLNSLSIEHEQSNPNILNFIHTETKKLQVKIFSNDHTTINTIYNTFLTYKNNSKSNIHFLSPTPSPSIKSTSHIDTIINNTDLILSQCKNWIYLYNVNFILFELSNIDNNSPNTNTNNNLKQFIISLISSNNTNSNLNIVSQILQKTTPFILYRNKTILSFIYFILITFLILTLSNMFYITLLIMFFTFIYFTVVPFYNKMNSKLLTFINQIVVCVRRGVSSSQWQSYLDVKELCFMRLSSIIRNKTVKELTEMLIVNGEKKEGAQPNVIKNINEDMNVVYWFQGDVLMRVDIIEKRNVLHLGKDVIMIEIYIPLNVENKKEVMDLIWESYRIIKVARYLKE